MSAIVETGRSGFDQTMDRCALELDVPNRPTRSLLNSPQLRLPSGFFQHARHGALDPSATSDLLNSPPRSGQSHMQRGPLATEPPGPDQIH
jgi:hypothetical protein